MVVKVENAMDERVCKGGRNYVGCAILWKPIVKGIVVPAECQSNIHIWGCWSSSL